ncbi:MAG: fasciclin domain-containing protein [Oscillatoriophycideae cyanobacterium NC_groundwater_1537_Pr4_S-0.65um_50_18]|nr:fasciclin domain-containing protein [Oscillatoriophycideae cyanobacterium NC_groundwater_1537_Pr4_S-0.65um_50_18]
MTTLFSSARLFFSARLFKCLSLTGLLGMGLIASPGFANSSANSDLASGESDRLTFQSAATSMPQALMPAGSVVAQAEQDVISIATEAGSFTTLLQLLEELGMTEDLKGYGRFTVFAPTDAAFAAIPSEIMEKLSEDRELMSKVLAYHVISGASPLTSDQISGSVSVRTLERSEVRITKRRGRLYVNSNRVIDADIEASNGVIHAIDRVLIPEDLLSQLRR